MQTSKYAPSFPGAYLPRPFVIMRELRRPDIATYPTMLFTSVLVCWRLGFRRVV